MHFESTFVVVFEDSIFLDEFIDLSGPVLKLRQEQLMHFLYVEVVEEGIGSVWVVYFYSGHGD